MPGAWFRGKPVAQEEPLKLVTDRPEPEKPASIEPTEPTLMGGHMETRLMELFHKLDGAAAHLHCDTHALCLQ